MNKITPKNYFESVKEIGFENLPLVLKQSHMVIMTKTDNGSDWSRYRSDAELKRMIDLAFQKLGELVQSKKDFSDISSESDQYPAEGFIREFLKMVDGTVFREGLEDFINRLQEAIRTGEISKKSPLAKEITHLQGILIKLFNTMGESTNVQLKLETKKMLEAAIKKVKVKVKEKVQVKPKLKNPARKVDLGKGLGDIPENAIAGDGNVMRSTDFTKLQFNTIGFKDKWLAFIGDPAPGFTAMVYGMPKMGKSYLCVDFAGYLARNHGKVLYVAKEEKLDKTLQDKLKDKEVAHPHLFVADALPKDLSEFDFIFLDSVNKLGLSPKDLEKLKAEHKGKSFVYVFQATKDGKFKGNNEFQHDVDVVIEVPEQGKAVQFGRFNQGGELNIFPLSVSDLTVKENVSMLDGINDKKMKKKDIPASTSKSKLKKKLSGKSRQDLIRFDDKDDANNPRYLFSLTSTKLLSEALKGEFDLLYLIRKELANRGQDKDGNWVGFKKAEEIHKV